MITMRLFFYVLAAVVASAGGFCHADEPARWAYDEDVDKITDLAGALAMVKATDGQSMLVIQCDYSKPDRPILFQIRPAEHRYFGPRPRVALRPDGGAVTSFDWYSLGKVIATFEPYQARRVGRAIALAKRVFIRILDDDSQSVDLEFLIGEPAPLFAKVLATCGKNEAFISDFNGTATQR